VTNLGAVDEDVRFDWVAADDLSARLRSTATVLDEQVGTRTTSHDTARAVWRGRYAVEFDDRVSTCTGDATRFATSMWNAVDTPVRTRVHVHDEPIDPSRVDTLLSRNNVPPTTWGDGVENRIDRQNATYRNRYPQGSGITGWNGS
jgi:hypothetical protein